MLDNCIASGLARVNRAWGRRSRRNPGFGLPTSRGAEAVSSGRQHVSRHARHLTGDTGGTATGSLAGSATEVESFSCVSWRTDAPRQAG
jgi:hypothetical protein